MAEEALSRYGFLLASCIAFGCTAQRSPPEGALPDASAYQADASETRSGDADRDSPDSATAPVNVDAGPDTNLPADSPAAPDYLTELAAPSDYSRLAGAGGELKFLLPTTTALPPELQGASCIFQNTARFPFHFDFARTQEGWETLDLVTFDRWVHTGSPPNAWAGSLKPVIGLQHPIRDESGTLLFSVSGEEPLTAEEVVQLARTLEACAPNTAPALAYIPLGAGQLEGFQELKVVLAKQGVGAVSPEELSAVLGGEVYSAGEGYGYLRLPGTGDVRPGRRDIVLFASAPHDLGIVAGVVSELPQSLHSHLNLRLKEKQVPNASLPGILTNPLLESLEGTLVRLVVDEQLGTLLEPTTLAAAQEFWDRTRPEIGSLTANLEQKEWRSYSELKSSDANAFGTKAANLGELYRALPGENRLKGFAIPFNEYHEFIANTELTPFIEEAVSTISGSANAFDRAAQLKSLRQIIRARTLPQAFVERLQASIVNEFGQSGLSTRLRFRSSTNAEDLRAFSGAGLYDSRSGCLADDLDDDSLGPSRCLTPENKAAYEEQLEARRAQYKESPGEVWLAEEIADLEKELTQEKSAAKAILRVWSSLWNAAAYEEREFYGLAHLDAFMGIAIQRSHSFERLQAVALTELSAADGTAYSRLVSQVGEIGVVEPLDPSTSPEVLTFRRSNDGEVVELHRVSESNLADGPLFTGAEIRAVAAHLSTIQEHFEKEVYPDTSPLRLDIELKITSDGALLFKQARPYLSSN